MQNILNNIGLIDDYPNCFSKFLLQEFGGWCSEYIYCSIDNEHIERYKKIKNGEGLSVLFIFMNDTLIPDPITYGVYGAVCDYIGDDVIISEINYFGEAPTMMQIENENNKAWDLVTKTHKAFTDKYQLSERFLIMKVVDRISDLKDLITAWDEQAWYETSIYEAF